MSLFLVSEDSNAYSRNGHDDAQAEQHEQTVPHLRTLQVFSSLLVKLGLERLGGKESYCNQIVKISVSHSRH